MLLVIYRKCAVDTLFRQDGLGAEIRVGNTDGNNRTPFPLKLGRYCCADYLAGYWTFKKSLPNKRSLIERADRRIASLRTMAHDASSRIVADLLRGLLQLQMRLYFYKLLGVHDAGLNQRYLFL